MDNVEHMVNGKGHLVPVEQVSDYDKAKNDLVIETIDEVESLQAVLKEFKTAILGNVAAFMEIAAEKYGAKVGGKKGNVQLLSYDGNLRVQLAVAEFLTFDERLQVAKSLVDECLNEWTEDSRPEVRTLVNMAFEVDKQGNVSPSKIQPLLKLEIHDEKWQRAMAAIRDSLTVQYSKQYIRFHRRSGPEGKWESIPLDIAAL
ncbi:MAG: sulfate transporter [Desulfovibrio sp.]|nr:sulfate transporter [Desulfovibrio sp.]|tara:strand:- start:15717 stop:16322 length:606 start_codon:yes stop_codon:yes gene_type:complete